MNKPRMDAKVTRTKALSCRRKNIKKCLCRPPLRLRESAFILPRRISGRRLSAFIGVNSRFIRGSFIPGYGLLEQVPVIRLLVFSLWLSTAVANAEPVLRWAGDPNSNAPYAFYSKGKQLVGFEYEIINAVANRLGRRAQFVQNDWNGLIPGLQRDLYDCVIEGIEITPDKTEQVSFSIPYYFTFEQFVSRRGAPPFTSLEQLRDRKIGTLDQTAALRMLEQTPGVIVKTYDQELSAYQDIVNGRLFGVLLDYPIAKYYAAPNPALELSGPAFGQVAYGIAINKNNSTLKSEIDTALRDLIASGDLRNILSRWGLWTTNVAQALDQPEQPSVPDTEYQAFVAIQTSPQSFGHGWKVMVEPGNYWAMPRCLP